MADIVEAVILRLGKAQANEVPAPSAPPPPEKVEKKTLADWALVYFPDSAVATGVKRLSRYRELGREAGAEAPIEEPAKMPAWFADMRARGKFTLDCPESVLAAAGGASAPVLPAARVRDDRAITEADRAPERMLEQLEAEVVRLGREYHVLERTSGDQVALDIARKRWGEAADRATAQRHRLAKTGMLVDRESVCAAFRRIVVPLPGFILRAMLADRELLALGITKEIATRVIQRSFAMIPDNAEELMES